MTCEEDLAFHCISIFLTYTISEYGRLKMAGETVPPIDIQESDLAEKWLSCSSSFQDGPHNISLKAKTAPQKQPSPKKQCGKSLSTSFISVPSLKVLS